MRGLNYDYASRTLQDDDIRIWYLRANNLQDLSCERKYSNYEVRGDIGVMTAEIFGNLKTYSLTYLLGSGEPVVH